MNTQIQKLSTANTQSKNIHAAEPKRNITKVFYSKAFAADIKHCQCAEYFNLVVCSHCIKNHSRAVFAESCSCMAEVY